MGEIYEEVDVILKKYDNKVENLLPILLEVQGICEGRYVTPDLANYIAEALQIPNSQISEVFSFFAAFNQSKKGQYHIEMCNSTVCRINDADVLQKYLEEKLQIKVGETTEDGLFTLDHAPCFGACDISPSVRINKIAYGHLTTEKLDKILKKMRGEI